MIEPRHEHSAGGAIRAKLVRNKNTWNAVPTSRLEFRNPKNRHRGPQVRTRNDAGDPVPGGAIEVDPLVLARGLGLDVASLHEFMREGKITNLRERGVDNDL